MNSIRISEGGLLVAQAAVIRSADVAAIQVEAKPFSQEEASALRSTVRVLQIEVSVLQRQGAVILRQLSDRLAESAAFQLEVTGLQRKSAVFHRQLSDELTESAALREEVSALQKQVAVILERTGDDIAENPGLLQPLNIDGKKKVSFVIPCIGQQSSQKQLLPIRRKMPFTKKADLQ